MIYKIFIFTLAVFISTSIQASPIHFTFSGIGDLTLDGTIHNSTNFTVILDADTDDLQVEGVGGGNFILRACSCNY